MSTLIQIRNLEAPHQPEQPEKLAALAASMEREGWQGRPLLVLAVGEYFQAVTGSHRIAAAKAAGLEEVPCVEIDADAFYAEHEAEDLWDDDVRLSILREIGDADAARLMEAEIEAR